MNKITNLSEPREVRMCDMDIGQIGIITDEDEDIDKKYILCTPKCVIDLEDPRYFWDRELKFKVKILPKGTKLELEIVI